MSFRTFALACALGSAAVLAGVVAGDAHAQTAPFNVKIIGFNDYHGNLQTPGTLRRQHGDPARAATGGRRRRVSWRPTSRG